MSKTLESDLNPYSNAYDFELAAFTVIKDAFPNVQIFGFYFHLCQNFWSKLGELHVKSIIALPFVRISGLDHVLDILPESLPVELIDLLDWFEDFILAAKVVVVKVGDLYDFLR